ncbi:MAG TPA: transcription elongation factor NusA, partial [Synechococcales bacterium UBA8647]|nr:transcription elongation factor NusA [Synechococcales bacterium UBA8647]
MALVMLPGLSALIEDISEEKKLPANVVEAALREALLKGYERYRRTLYIGISEDPFDEEYFSNFDVGLDLDEEGYRVLASKIIVEEVESEDHQIGLADVQQVTDDAQLGDTVVLDVTPEKDDFGRMAAATTKQVLAQKLREHQRRMIQEEFADLEDPVLTARVIRFERQSVIMAVSSGLGRPEVEAELPRRDQLPNDNYRANATFKVFLKEVSEIARRGPQLFISRA